MTDDDRKDLEKRLVAVESTLAGLKIAAIVLGLTAAALVAYVSYVFEVARKADVTARQAQGQVDEKVTEGRRQIDAHVRAVLPSFGAALTQTACRDVTWRDCDDSGWATCPVGMYLAGVRNAGGTNSCVRTLRCCAPGQPSPAAPR